ncbi:hypothetical protein KBK19_11530 [Microvirga sp. STR05]|uniref:DUF4221 domain-containing protein n=1 Tax=Hymenobacter duratus TaxID=2771356 RepID=A0ABR8JJ82_9BACT|nr:hypothetical protein [Hymenobacter duratus]MBD2715668.1 hypothetical protein [Hymenobacter duratus]MBR7950576.1 hypothetical protein [Microvirga sp. STR05]
MLHFAFLTIRLTGARRFNCLLPLVLALHAVLASAQNAPLALQPISLPQEIADRNNQFSGLYIHHHQLLLLSESRLQERAEPKVYGLDLASLDRQLAGRSKELAYKKYTIRGLDAVRTKLDSAGTIYEGLEGLTMLDGMLYFSIETATASAYCYLVRGRLDDAQAIITLDSGYLLPLAKPTLPNGTHIYNAGFEGLESHGQNLLLLFEYNYFPQGNYALALPGAAATATTLRHVPLPPVPFRVTDLVREGKNRFTAINYFYNGPDDSVYRPALIDPATRLIRQDSSYQNYCRLISLRYKRHALRWKPLFELPREYMTYNWEGLAAHRGGYFLINDKYGPSNQSILLYVRKKGRK